MPCEVCKGVTKIGTPGVTCRWCDGTGLSLLERAEKLIISSNLLALAKEVKPRTEPPTDEEITVLANDLAKFRD